jgi:Zn-finger nucleic acid-binding protein
VVVCGQCNTASEPAPRAPEKVVQTLVVERVVVASDQKVTPCPRCRVGLFAVRASDVTVNGCGVCGGIWLDNAGSIAITKRSDPNLNALAARAAKNATVRNAGSTHEKLDCPVCQKQMQRVNAARIAELDVCNDHGTWFDAGELGRISSAYHDGDDDPLRPITGRRDPLEAQLTALAAANAPPPPVWQFEGPAGDAIVKVTAGVLGAVLVAAIAPSRK